jgi:hypothetical protein
MHLSDKAAGTTAPPYFDARIMSVVADPPDATRLSYSCMIAHDGAMTPVASGLAH